MISRAPKWRAHNVTAMPTGPPPMINTLSPRCNCARSTACRPTANGSTSAPSPCPNDSGRCERLTAADFDVLGVRATAAADTDGVGAALAVHDVALQARETSAAADERKRRDAIADFHDAGRVVPTATISPQNSWPMTSPMRMSARPSGRSRRCRTLRRATPDRSRPGAGSGCSTMSKVFCSLSTAARMRTLSEFDDGAAVDVEHGAGDEGRFVGREEQRRVGDVIGVAVTLDELRLFVVIPEDAVLAQPRRGTCR